MARDPKANVLRCQYCLSYTVGMGDYAQCPKGCPGRFDILQSVRVPIDGVEKSLADAKQEKPPKVGSIEAKEE